jgi:hypothetical protein
VGYLISKALRVLACFVGSVTSNHQCHVGHQTHQFRGNLAWSPRALRLLRSLRYLDYQSSVLYVWLCLHALIDVLGCQLSGYQCKKEKSRRRKDLGVISLYDKGHVCFHPERVGCVSGAGGAVHYLELFNDVFQISGEGTKGAGGSSFKVYKFVRSSVCLLCTGFVWLDSLLQEAFAHQCAALACPALVHGVL